MAHVSTLSSGRELKFNSHYTHTYNEMEELKSAAVGVTAVAGAAAAGFGRCMRRRRKHSSAQSYATYVDHHFHFFYFLYSQTPKTFAVPFLHTFLMVYGQRSFLYYYRHRRTVANSVLPSKSKPLVFVYSCSNSFALIFARGHFLDLADPVYSLSV